MHHYKWSVEEQENMTPWEHDVYADMTREHVRKLKEARERR